MNKWMDGWMERSTDRRTDERTNEYSNKKRVAESTETDELRRRIDYSLGTYADNKCTEDFMHGLATFWVAVIKD